METVPNLSVTSDTDPYGAVAGFYDWLHVGPGSADLVSFFADLAPEGGSGLEIGPGTGRMTLAVAPKLSSLYCLERSAVMRTILLTKLASRPELRDKVTILDEAVPGFRLERAFDYVYVSAVFEHIPPPARKALFAGLAEHLAPDGIVAMDMVEDEVIPRFPEREIRSVRQGDCRYTLSTAVTPVEPDLGHVRHVYRTYLGEELVATHTVERDHHMHRPADVFADLRAVGLEPVAGTALTKTGTPLDDKGTLVAKRV